MLIIFNIVEKIFVNSNSTFSVIANIKISNNIFQELITSVLPHLLRLGMNTKWVLDVQPSVDTIELLSLMFILTVVRFFSASPIKRYQSI